MKYSGQANAILCTAQGFGAGLVGDGTNAVAAAGCDNNWNWWWVGTRTQWNVTKDFYMGLDVAYTKLSGMTTGTGVLPTAMIPAGTNNGPRTIGDQDNWQARFRVHRDFYP